ncbi:MAG: tRNA (adenosine(37)-N6)-dimethylallyltransferase MiaA [Ruminococcus sp.]|nr:tRNA (adenosine(37)-N6)-dimethylallyltransferase MiaA [Ruminococcus sp.]
MNSEMKIPLISIVGPTASGKTSLSIELAKLFDGEIVSADSMQIYKGMDIATAKPTINERKEAVHHMIDFLDLDSVFSVAQYCEMAHSVISDIHERGKMPVLVGGTGLYVDSLINNITFSESECDGELRKELNEMYLSEGVEHLLDMLAEFDSESAKRLSVEKNVKRIIRAIEIYRTTGITMTEHNRKSRLVNSPYNVVKIGLTATDRQYLYDRINKRVDMMVEEGLVEEARLHFGVEHSDTSSMAIGHKELLPYIKGVASLDECIENLKMQTRRYAKRQLTWFRKDSDINWMYIDTLNNTELIDNSAKLIKKVLFNEEV